MTETLLSKYTRPVKKAEREIIGRDDEIKRVQAALMRPELCNVMLLGDAGSGKALDNRTLIPVADSRGYVEIGSLKVGDYVYDESGHSTRVLGVFPQGELSAYRMTFSDGSEVVCNDEHMWNVRSKAERYSRSSYDTMTLREILDKGVQPKDWWLPVAKPVLRAKRYFRFEPYAIGAVLALNLNIDVDVFVSGPDDEFMTKLARLLGVDYLHKTHFYETGFNGKNEPTYQWHYSRPRTNMFDVMAKYRRIPDLYFLGSTVQRFEMLQGFMDARGEVSGTSFAACVLWLDHKELAQDVVALANSVGIRCKFSKDDRGLFRVEFLSKYTTKYRLVSRASHIAALDVFKTKHVKRPRRYDDIYIESVEELHEKVEMTCIYVEADSHLFQATRNHLVTHNTALVQGTMLHDRNRDYQEVDLSRMIADARDGNEMGAMLKMLFDEVAEQVKVNRRDIVLFIDEFHQIVQLSESAVEALKPLLADSGTRGVRVIAATTYIEFRKWIAPNLPLVERLQRINLPEPGKDVVIEILKGMARRYDVASQIRDNGLFELIYEYTNRYIPSQSQPRKSILLLDAMIGWHRSYGRSFDTRLLGDVIYESEGVNVSFSIDAASIREQLDERVLSQKFATKMIEQRLQICAADLNNKKRPMSSFLFSGSTGVGKSLLDSEPIPVYEPKKRGYKNIPVKRNGDLQVGDYVFDRMGEPVRVAGVFPQGMQDVYEVELKDGRKIKCSGNHLWAYKARVGNKTWVVNTTEALKRILENPNRAHSSGVFIPMNKPVEYPEKHFPVDPYVMGVALVSGCLTERQFTIASSEEFIIQKVCDRIGAVGYDYRSKGSNSRVFSTGEIGGKNCKFKYRVQTKTVLGAFPELIGTYTGERRIPECYLYGSVKQRWELVQALFDTQGYISHGDGRYTLTYWTGSEGLLTDIRQLLWSLGISTTRVDRGHRPGRPDHYQDEYKLTVRVSNLQKPDFFTLPRKLAVANEAVRYYHNDKIRKLRYDEYIEVKSIKSLGYQESMTCIYLDDDEHLYQTGEYIITHNTEVSKGLAALLFGNEDAMIRFDMTEYANPESLERFRNELTNRVWARPFSIVLLDEIEKACSQVTRLLLQVLDDGRLMDENNRIVSFLNCYIIMTTNAGSEVYKNISQYNVDDEGSGEEIMKYAKVIRDSITGTTGDNRFPPELLGRIDVIVPFQPLSGETQKRIAEMNLKKLRDRVMTLHGVDLKVHSKVVRYLVEDTLDTNSDSGGARVVISKLESEVTIPVAKYINEHPNEKLVFVGILGELASDNENLRIGTAKVAVGNTMASIGIGPAANESDE